MKVLELGITISPFVYAALSNSGDGDVLAKSVTVRWNGQIHEYGLNRIIKSGAVEVIDREPPNTEEVWKKWKIKPRGYISNQTGAATPYHLKNADIPSESDGPTCFLVKVFDANNAWVKKMQGHYEEQKVKLVLGQATATVSFFSIHTGSIVEKPVPVIATFLNWDQAACKNE